MANMETKLERQSEIIERLIETNRNYGKNP